VIAIRSVHSDAPTHVKEPMSKHGSRESSGDYQAGSLSLAGAVAMGTGVMIGAGIFALTGQVAQLAGSLFPLAFVVAAIVSGFSAYSYIQLASAYPSAGGIGMFLMKAYGRSVWTGGFALLMVLSMIINESLVARTFGTYVMQAVDAAADPVWVPALGVALIAVVFAVNIATNALISRVALVSALLKVGGVLLFAGVTLWFADFSFRPAAAAAAATAPGPGGVTGFIAAVALGILAYKGFTTITNSGSELKNPEQNIGRAIVISLAICLVVYLLVAWAVGSTLSIEAIAKARDYALAEASRPALGRYGAWFTIAVAIVATASGLLASVFAVSRMLAMLTKMELIPHRHLGMTGDLQTHMLVYTCASAALLAAFFDLGRIAALGAIFYLLMDIGIHWGLYRHLRDDVPARPAILVTAMALDVLLLGVFLWVKAGEEPMILAWAAGGVAAIFLLEWQFLRVHKFSDGEDPNYRSPEKSDEPDKDDSQGPNG
jgi:amino acid transporter